MIFDVEVHGDAEQHADGPVVDDLIARADYGPIREAKRRSRYHCVTDDTLGFNLPTANDQPVQLRRCREQIRNGRREDAEQHDGREYCRKGGVGHDD